MTDSSQAVGQVADVLSIAVPVVGLLAFVLTAFNLNPFAPEQTDTVVITMAAFLVAGGAAVGTAFVRIRRDDTVFSERRLAGARTLYRVGFLLLFLALASGLLLVLHPAPVSCPTAR